MNKHEPVFLSDTKGKLFRGKHSYIQKSAVIDCSGNVTLGEKAYISHRVRILTHIHKIPPRNKCRWDIVDDDDYTVPTDLVIEAEAWINQDALILPQVNRIGKGAYIGANAVVTKDVPAYEIWAGNPARKIGERE